MTDVRARRNRRSLSVGIAAVVVIIVGIGFVLATADPADSPATTAPPTEPPTTDFPATTEPPTTEPPTIWTPPADDPTQPSPAAVAADREFRVAPADLDDCGVHVRTSGWPTTTRFGTDLLDCILDAADTGTPAQFVTTARDFRGGMEGTIFRVLGPAEILVIAYEADIAGVVTSSESTCAALSAGNSAIPECA